MLRLIRNSELNRKPMRSIRTIQDLLTERIMWLKTPERPQWSAKVCDELCELTMNDFPEEPLYTVRWRGQSMDIDDAPSSWVIP
ncbi:MAG: hypothetical protein JWN25_738 [Verrucomicrobiales bacterium]|nr:hypothetical protein [Verrucomicrobiales bacterium]